MVTSTTASGRYFIVIFFNRVLMETREMLEEQLTSTRRRSDKVPELESEIIKYKQLLNDATLVGESTCYSHRLVFSIF